MVKKGQKWGIKTHTSKFSRHQSRRLSYFREEKHLFIGLVEEQPVIHNTKQALFQNLVSCLVVYSLLRQLTSKAAS